MKKLLVLSLLGAFALMSQPIHAQCNDDLLAKAAESLNGFMYVKDLKVYFKKTKKGRSPLSAKYSLVLNKGTKYKLISANAKEMEGKLVYKLFGPSGTMVLTNYNQQTGALYDVVDYTCRASGLYYLVVNFTDGEEGCAIALLGFQEKKSEYQQYLDKFK